MALTELVVHQIEKKPDGTPSVLRPRETLLPVNEATEALLSRLLAQFNSREDKLFGFFTEEPAEGQEESAGEFRILLEKYLAGELDGLSFSTESLQRFQKAIDAQNFAVGGYLFFIRYKVGMTDYLLIALLSQVADVCLDQEMNIAEIEHLDLGAIHLAARINLSEMQGNASANRYITLIRGRGKAKVAKYFSEFLGCEEVTGSKKETQALVASVEDFCKTRKLDDEQVRASKQKAWEYCDEKAKSGETVQLKDIAEVMDANDPDSFLAFASEREYGLGEEISPQRHSLRSLVRISGSDKQISISFDAGLLGTRVEYLEETDTLMIKGIPEALRKKILDGK